LGSQDVTIAVNLLLFIAEHYLPLSFMYSLLAALRSCFPSYPILKQLSIGKQNSSNINRSGVIVC